MIGSGDALRQAILTGRLDDPLSLLYGEAALGQARERYAGLLDRLDTTDGGEWFLFSSPGRTELGGNHTDHNHGNVLAATVDLDCVAAVTPLSQPVVELRSQAVPRLIRVELDRLEPQAGEEGTPEALVRGVAAAFAMAGGELRGFRGVVDATCPPGAGLSSSAAFAVLCGTVFTLLEGRERYSAERLARMAAEAENRFFGKPCGLMDQMTSAVGGVLAMDFLDPDRPKLRRLSPSVGLDGYRLVVVNTGANHVELTAEYGAVPEEMQAAARVLGSRVGRGLTVPEVLSHLPQIRRTAGDRAALRLLHFIEENERVRAMTLALEEGRLSDYLELVRASGESSALLLQNCASVGNSREQGILLALALTRRFCKEAVARVHGGGFAGTIQAYVPADVLSCYTAKIEAVFGPGTVLPLTVGRPGACGLGEGGLFELPKETGV